MSAVRSARLPCATPPALLNVTPPTCSDPPSYSGVSGVINPPSANKYGYWTNDSLPATPDAWLEGAQQHPGSWWSDWIEWQKPYNGPKVAARKPGAGKLKAIEDAPGRYVQRLKD